MFGLSISCPGDISDGPEAVISCREDDLTEVRAIISFRRVSSDEERDVIYCPRATPNALPDGIYCRRDKPDGLTAIISCRHVTPNTRRDGMSCRRDISDEPTDMSNEPSEASNERADAPSELRACLKIAWGPARVWGARASGALWSASRRPVEAQQNTHSPVTPTRPLRAIGGTPMAAVETTALPLLTASFQFSFRPGRRPPPPDLNWLPPP